MTARTRGTCPAARRRLARGLHAVRLVAGPLAFLLFVSACAINPASGRRELALIDEASEIEIGREIDANLVADVGVYGDASLGRYVTEIGAALAAGSERPGLPWQFRVLDDPTVNAFALPGGYVYVTRGLLAHLGSEAELAAVLAHEIAHVTARHSVTQISRAILAERGVGLFRVIDPLDNHIHAAMSRRVDLSLLRHSREHEIESDDLASRYLERGGYDATALIDVLDTLARLDAAKDGPRLPSTRSTHPDPALRRDRQRELASAAGRVARERDADRYFARIDGLVFGADPRRGYRSGDSYVDPATGLSLGLPARWHSDLGREFMAASSDAGDGLLLLTRTGYASAEEGLIAFLGHPAIRAGPAWTGPTAIPDLVARHFVLLQAAGQLEGVVAFFTHEGAARLLIAIARGAEAPALLERATGAMATIRVVDDPRLLEVSPMRIRIVDVERATTLRAWVEGIPGSIELATLAVINHVDPDQLLAAEARIKSVSAFRAPLVAGSGD